jgi:hypothetical protein
MTDDTPDEAPPREWQLFGLTWNEVDLKSVIITVGGTIAGGLAVVATVGLALAAAHWWVPRPNIFAVIIIGAVGVFGISSLFYRPKPPVLASTARVMLLMKAILGGVGVFFLLVVIGIAAGIK